MSLSKVTPEIGEIWRCPHCNFLNAMPMRVTTEKPTQFDDGKGELVVSVGLASDHRDTVFCLSCESEVEID